VIDKPVIDGQLLDVLADLEVEFERVSSGAYLVTLRGPRALHVWLIGGEQDVAVEAFVCHVLDGAPVEAAHAYLLARNRSLRGAHFALDEVGDVFLTGSLALADVTTVAVDRLLAELWEVLIADLPRLLTLLYGEQVPAKALLDGAGRRAAGTPVWAPRRDARR
jgi:hypothetical protein